MTKVEVASWKEGDLEGRKACDVYVGTEGKNDDTIPGRHDPAGGKLTRPLKQRFAMGNCPLPKNERLKHDIWHTSSSHLNPGQTLLR